MESALERPIRHIEYPSDLSACDSIEIDGRRLLYLRSQAGNMQFVVVLGFYAGQKDDVVTKEIIEPVDASNQESITCKLAPECGRGRIIFL